MKREKISETIANIDEKYIEEAGAYGHAAKANIKKAWYKWAAVAASLTLVLVFGISFGKDLFAPSGHKDSVDPIRMIEYDAAYWEIVEDKSTLQKHGLTKELTEDAIGYHIAYLQKTSPEAEFSDYQATGEETDLELLAYAPAPYQAVRIFRDGDKYYYALFSNYQILASESLPMRAVLDLYGISTADDIISIRPVKSNETWETNGEIVTERAAVEAFVREITVLHAFSFDAYHDSVFAEELNQHEESNDDSEIYAQVADDRNDIMIETKEGLRFVINYYPTYGWVYVTQTMSYYQMTPEITEWISTNIK